MRSGEDTEPRTRVGGTHRAIRRRGSERRAHTVSRSLRTSRRPPRVHEDGGVRREERDSAHRSDIPARSRRVSPRINSASRSSRLARGVYAISFSFFFPRTFSLLSLVR